MRCGIRGTGTGARGPSSKSHCVYVGGRDMLDGKKDRWHVEDFDNKHMVVWWMEDGAEAPWLCCVPLVLEPGGLWSQQVPLEAWIQLRGDP